MGYPSDDINKFLWMVRIGGGVFPEIKENDYLNGQIFEHSTICKIIKIIFFFTKFSLNSSVG